MERERNKQVEAAEEAQAAWIKHRHDQANFMTTAERAKARKMADYYAFKHGNCPMFYYLYPEERPKRDSAEAQGIPEELPKQDQAATLEPPRIRRRRR